MLSSKESENTAVKKNKKHRRKKNTKHFLKAKKVFLLLKDLPVM